MSDRLAVLPQYLFPKQALTELMGTLAGHKGGARTTQVIRWFIKRYGVDMSEAAQADPAAYASFNDFFTRALRPGARPLARADLLCPVDSAISQLGPIQGEQIFQAKGHQYSTTALVGGDAALAAQFTNGHFATLYLSPRDYHRIHMPCDGQLRRMIHVPGELFSVNPTTARGVPGLFARNERVVCVFDSAAGPFVLVLVGATIVGSMATVWHGLVNPPRPGKLREWSYEAGKVTLSQGQEMGRFLLGSTVVLLFPAGPLRFEPSWAPGGAIRMGQVGVVTSINAGVRYTGEVIGTACHAGTTPMTQRHDAASAVAEFMLAMESRAAQDGDSVATVGQLHVPGGSVNVVPGRCQFSVDLRAPGNAQRDRLETDMQAALADICQRRKVSFTLVESMRASAAPSAPQWQHRWESAVTALGLPVHTMPSGAGHDAMKLHEIMPQAMLFVRGENAGISHNPLEATTSDDMQLAVEAFSHLLEQLSRETPPA